MLLQIAQDGDLECFSQGDLDRFSLFICKLKAAKLFYFSFPNMSRNPHISSFFRSQTSPQRGPFSEQRRGSGGPWDRPRSARRRPQSQGSRSRCSGDSRKSPCFGKQPGANTLKGVLFGGPTRGQHLQCRMRPLVAFKYRPPKSTPLRVGKKSFIFFPSLVA